MLGLQVGILCLFYVPDVSLVLLRFLPPLSVGIVAALLVVICLYNGRFLLCGLCLSLISVWAGVDLPYQQVFSDCQFEASISRPNYSTRRTGREVRLIAQKIVCDQHELPDQVIQYWDDKQQLTTWVGKRFVAAAQLHPVKTRLNPMGFDYEKYMLSAHIRLSAKKLSVIRAVGDAALLLRARDKVSQMLHANLSTRNASILQALLTGNRSALTPAQRQTMQATGTSHLLAISGLHLGLVGGAVWLLFQVLWSLSWRLSDWVSPRHAGAVAAFMAITVYAIFTGFDIPVQRAWIMFSLLIVAWLCARGVSNTLLLAACVVMLVSPYAVVSVGFYFSFLAAFVVLWASRLPYSFLIRVLLMQLVIGGVMLPITWSVFGMVSLSAFAANLLIIPWLGVWVLPWAMLAVLLTFTFPVLASPLWQLVDTTTDWLWQTIVSVEQLNWVVAPASQPHVLAVVVAVIGVLLALITRKKRFLLAYLCIFLPSKWSVSPEIVVLDKRFTSALIHDSKHALLINPGRRYRQINDAALWQQYLQQHRLTLSAIILQNPLFTRISATKWLLDHNLAARVITLEPFPLPFSADYCQSYSVGQIQVVAAQTAQSCYVNLWWQNHAIALFPNQLTDNALLDKGVLRWRGEIFDAQQQGAITLTADAEVITWQGLRQHERLWRQQPSRID